jgi:hypothetical protein
VLFRLGGVEQVENVQLPDATDRYTLICDAFKLLYRHDLSRLGVLALVHDPITSLRYFFGYGILFFQCGLLFHDSLEK